MTRRFDPVTERDVDVAEVVFRRVLCALACTLSQYPDRAPHDVSEILCSDPELRAHLRRHLEEEPPQ